MTLPIQESDEVEEYVPPVPKKWISLGSEVEIDTERLILNRPLVREDNSGLINKLLPKTILIYEIETFSNKSSTACNNSSTTRKIQRC